MGATIKGYKNRKKYYKSIGIQSVYDIINKVEWEEQVKVDYIRHHYTYYDGYQDMFHDENGQPNENKRILNEVILGIVQKEFDPSYLKELDKAMIEWRKTHPAPKTEPVITSTAINVIQNMSIKGRQKLRELQEEERKQKMYDTLINKLLEEYPYAKDYVNRKTLIDYALRPCFNMPSEETFIKMKEIYMSWNKGSFNLMNHKEIQEIHREIKRQEKLKRKTKEAENKALNRLIEGYNKTMSV